MKEVLIIGGNHQNPLGVMEALGQKGIMSNVIVQNNGKNSFVLKSKYVKKGWVCSNGKEIINCILDNFKSTKEKIVAIACSDNAASLLSDNYNLLSSFLIMPGMPQQGQLTAWMDKEKMIEEATRIGLKVPQTWLVHKGNIPDSLEYPCVTKSLTSVGNGKAEFNMCMSRQELETFLKEQAYSETIQVQQYIDNAFEFQYLGCSLNGGTEIIIPGRTHIEATSHFNNLTFLKYMESKVIEDSTTLTKTEDFIRQTGYTGLFSVEFMHGKDGKDYFLEMNFRNDGNGFVVTSAGTNLPYIYYLYSAGMDYRSELAQSCVRESYLMPEDSYFMLMLDGEISFKEWWKNMKKTTCFLTYYKGNTKPFWSLLWLQKRPLFASIVKLLLRPIISI